MELQTSIQTLSASQQHPNPTELIHVADLHVRTGRDRAKEYVAVFDAFFASLVDRPAVRAGTAVIIVCGDVFHEKGRLDTEALRVFFSFLGRALQLAPVLMICGNHDYRQEAGSEQTDCIECIAGVENLFSHCKYPFHYLKDTGLYAWEDVLFGVVSIKDVLDPRRRSGSVPELPPFPDPELHRHSARVRVALFHGMLRGSSFFKGPTTTSGPSAEWFRGYDLVLLGDIHKREIRRVPALNLTWAYAGSMVQQNFGEDLEGHGYIAWNLGEGERIDATPVDLPNAYAHVTLRTSKLSLEESRKYPRVRLLLEPGEDRRAALDALNKYLDVHGVQPSSIRCIYNHVINQGPTRTPSTSSIDAINEMDKQSAIRSLLNTPSRWLEYLGQNMSTGASEAVCTLARQYICKPDAFLLDLPRALDIDADIMSKVLQYNVQIQKSIDAFASSQTSGESVTTTSVTFLRMEWEYLLCYGPGNYFDFSAIDGHMALLNGKNASGKSAFFDIICVALFGEVTISRATTTTSARSLLVNLDKPDGRRAHVTLDVYISSPSTTSTSTSTKTKTSEPTRYRIYRSFDVRKATGARHTIAAWVARHSMDDNNCEELTKVADGVLQVNAWVARHVGQLDDFLMSNMVCQADGATGGFFTKDKKEQRVILEKALCVDSLTAFGRIIAEASKAYKGIASRLEDYMRGLSSGLEGPGRELEDLDLDQSIEKAHRLCDIEASLEGALEDLNIDFIHSQPCEPCEIDDELFSNASVVVETALRTASALRELQTRGELLDKLEHKLPPRESDGDEDGDDKEAEETPAALQHAIDAYLALDPQNESKAYDCNSYSVRLAELNDCLQRVTRALDATTAVYNFSETHKDDDDEPEHDQEHDQEIDEDLWRAVRRTQDASIAANEERARLEELTTNIVEESTLPPPPHLAVDYNKITVTMARAAVKTCEARVHESSASALPKPHGAPPASHDEFQLDKDMDPEDSVEEPSPPERAREHQAKFEARWNAWMERVSAVKEMEPEARMARLDILLPMVERASSEASLSALRLTALEEELAHAESACAEEPHNADCWACNARPAYMRLTDLRDRVAEQRGRVASSADQVAALLRDCQIESLECGREERAACAYYLTHVEEMTEEAAAWARSERQWAAQARWDRRRWSAYIAWRDAHQVALSDLSHARHTLLDAQSRSSAAAQAVFEESLADLSRRVSRARVLVMAWAAEIVALNNAREKANLCRRLQCARALHIKQRARIMAACSESLVPLASAIRKYGARRRLLELHERRAVVKEARARAARVAEVRSIYSEALRYVDRHRLALEEVHRHFGPSSSAASSGPSSQASTSQASTSQSSSSSFLTHIFRDVLVDILDARVNALLTSIEPSLQMSFGWDGANLTHRIFFVPNRGYQHPIERERSRAVSLAFCSGYQKFVIGLVMRVVLSRIGAVGVPIQHLFIDEGFTALDRDNLGRTHAILDSLMDSGGFRSIILMSHLDVIKDAADVHIDIALHDDANLGHRTSQIRF